MMLAVIITMLQGSTMHHGSEAGMSLATNPKTSVNRPRDLVSPELFDRLVGRITKDHGLDEDQATEIMEGTIGFLQLVSLYPAMCFGPSKQIDIGWHTFILYTREYAVFCQTINGKFIHHEPNDNPAFQPTFIGVEQTLAAMRYAGIPHNPNLWEQPQPDCAAKDCSDCKACMGCSPLDRFQG